MSAFTPPVSFKAIHSAEYASADPLRYEIAHTFASGLALLMAITLAEYALGWNPGIDQWLFNELSGTIGTSIPGRIAPETAMCFVLLTAAILMGASRRALRWVYLGAARASLLVTVLAGGLRPVHGGRPAGALLASSE